ncbi:patatin-like phospholipase family protein [Limnoglobus roseus]|uniref:Patatin n=1 Tax=Limnoglobus roseus TaxID=2598579 RepID=A0A5C1AMD0_9BACT|nr:patatin-like phospholipase family protein [Limnoglobus roseus]QEL19116.1 patatin [Limnoglobus roseus]
MLTAPRVGWFVSCAALAALLPFAVGCRLVPSNDPPKELLKQTWKEPGREGYTHPQTDKIIIENLAAECSGAPRSGPVAVVKPMNILSLSAGGKYGAYSAGILAGWTVHGTRPDFDIVTGVSSGAIVSVYAFLGPQYDDKLKKFFTETDQSDLFKLRPLHNLSFHGSLGYPYGMKQVIEEEITCDRLAEIAAAHQAGRRLYIGTLNIHEKQLTIWDIGEIACRGTPESVALVRKVILAATAVPGLLPPVEIDVVVDGKHYTEIHSDAGVVAQSFIRFAPHQVPTPGTKALVGSQLYCLAAGKIDPDPVIGRMGILKRVGAGVSSSLYALYKEELIKMYALCVTTGMQFNLAAIPKDYKIDEISTRIRAREMRPLYESGYQAAVQGMVWRQTPPGALTGEEPEARSGTVFHTVR